MDDDDDIGMKGEWRVGAKEEEEEDADDDIGTGRGVGEEEYNKCSVNGTVQARDFKPLLRDHHCLNIHMSDILFQGKCSFYSFLPERDGNIEDLSCWMSVGFLRNTFLSYSGARL